MITEGDYYGLELNYKKCTEELAEAKVKFRNLSSLYLRSKDEISAHKNEISALKKELAEIEEARTLTAAIPESWGWSDCFFCSEPIKDNANHDVFMGKSIHKECREKLIDGLNASYREKEKKEKEKDES